MTCAHGELAHVLEDLRKCLDTLDITPSVAQVSKMPRCSGGYADIYDAWWKPPGRNEQVKVAVKFLRWAVAPALKTKEAIPMIKRLRQEISVWRRLEHPNVQLLRGLWWDPSCVLPAMVSTWEAGGDINVHSARLALTMSGSELSSTKNKLLEDVLHGLMYLHEKKIIHADVKGANVLVSATGTALLCDFGVAWTTIKNSVSFAWDQSAQGTSRWMAPELFEYAEDTDSANMHTVESDIWAYGCLYLEVHSGTVPYSNKKSEQSVIISLWKRELPIRPTNVDDETWALITLCCTPDPAVRPPSSEVLARVQALIGWGGAQRLTPPEDRPL